MSTQTETQVVNIHQKVPYDVYIGRKWDTKMHYGNPFTHMSSNMPGIVKVESREDAVRCFGDWLLGIAFQDVDPERRQWIISNLPGLRGKVLGCFCHPKACHGHVYKQILDAKYEGQ